MDAAKLPLKEKWSMWFHRLDDNDWSIRSYRLVYTFSTVQDFWRMANSLPPVYSGLFFLMKEGVQPMWEHESNKNGAIWSFRVAAKKKLHEVWNDLLVRLVGNTLVPDDELVNGVSINPKNFVIKVWLREHPGDGATCDVSDKIPHLQPERALLLRART